MTKTISLDHITKVEGHASLRVVIDKGIVEKCELSVVEGSRLFEGLLVGKRFDDAKEITSRICGICSVSHSLASLIAVEKALRVKPSSQSQLLRRMMSLGEMIRSHATHLYFLSLPDYLGYGSALEMAPHHQDAVNHALSLIRFGNELVRVIAGRSIHPVASVVGGFTHVPSNSDRLRLRRACKEVLPAARYTLALFLKLSYPSLSTNVPFLAIKQSKKGLLTGKIISTTNISFPPERYDSFIEEFIDTSSTAKFAVVEGKTYMVGALARINTNYSLLSPIIKHELRKAGFVFPSSNPFHNILAQAVEVYDAVLKLERLLEKPFKPEKVKNVKVRKGRGISAVEAPRGILFHDYEFDSNGGVVRANIITPTVQNLKNLELDIKSYLSSLLKQHLSKEALVLEIEKLIRAYDPCFSCSTHFLRVDWHSS